MFKKRMNLAILCAFLAVPGCIAVSKDAYDRDLGAMKQQQDLLEGQKKTLADQLAASQGKNTKCDSDLSTCIREKQAALDELSGTKKALEQCTRSRGSGAVELAQCQIDKDKAQVELSRMKEESSRLQAELKELKDRLGKIEEGIRKVRERLQKLVDGGKLRVKIQAGFLVIEVSSDILFDLNKSDIKPTAKPVLLEIASALKDMADKRFQVAGHTDNTGAAALNWRLSTARAIAVVEELVNQDGVSPDKLSAGGYGPYLPVAENATEEGRKRNRRVEFLLMPDLSELLNLAQ